MADQDFWVIFETQNISEDLWKKLIVDRRRNVVDFKFIFFSVCGQNIRPLWVEIIRNWLSLFIFAFQ